MSGQEIILVGVMEEVCTSEGWRKDGEGRREWEKGKASHSKNNQASFNETSFISALKNIQKCSHVMTKHKKR